jgi:hypothetical protein
MNRHLAYCICDETTLKLSLRATHINNEVYIDYLADCKICMFAEEVSKYAFYTCSMQNACNLKPSDES